MVIDVVPHVNEHNGLLKWIIIDNIVFNEWNIAVIEAAPLVLSISVRYIRNVVAWKI